MPQGYVVLVLHAHLPYVLSHGKWPHGSDWLCEAVCETYIPLLNLLGRLSAEGKRANLTIGITPILCEMLASDLFKTGLKEYVDEKIEAAMHDRDSFSKSGEEYQALLAERWERFYRSIRHDFTDIYGEDLLGAFRRFQVEGRIELIVSAATHAYLPLLGLDSSINAQIKQGVETYRKYFWKEPQGIWLPECAYRPGTEFCTGNPGKALKREGLEAFLAALNLNYFFLDGNHVLQKGSSEGGYASNVGQGLPTEVPMKQEMKEERVGYRTETDSVEAIGPETARTEGQTTLYGVHKTGAPPSGECAFFARDTDTSLQVWSARWGYPGDPFYLEFHKKHDPGGLRYWRVTDHQGDLGTKLLYEPHKALERVEAHARHFSAVIMEKLGRYHEETGRTGVLTVPFDAELFGHWWFEGIDWLYALISAFDANYVTIEQASAALKSVIPLGTISLPEGSWGEGGHHFIWHNEDTVWMWGCIHEAERDMVNAVKELPENRVSTRILKQMARELLLLQSSDWQFLVTTKSAEEYGASRFLGHYRSFKELQHILDTYRATQRLEPDDENALAAIEARDAVFENVKLEWFGERI